MPLVADGRKVLSTTEAHARSGLTAGYISLLARRGELEAIRVGNYWLIYEDAFERFLALPRKPGPQSRLVRPSSTSS